MRRREFMTAVGGAVIAWPLPARAQQARKVSRIGVLWHAANEEEEEVYLSALRRGFSDLGYVEGRNIALVNTFAGEVYERFHDNAVELVRQKVDVIVAVTRLAAVAAQRATSTIPVVFVVVPDPIKSALIDSFARPGKNITGLTNMAVDLAAKRLEIFKEIIPGMSKMALLVNDTDPQIARGFVEEIGAASRKLNVTVRPVEIRTPEDLDQAFLVIAQEHLDAVYAVQDGLFFAERVRMGSARHRASAVHERAKWTLSTVQSLCAGMRAHKPG